MPRKAARRQAPKKAAKKSDRKSVGGRPSKYQEQYAVQARKLALLGATDAEMAEFFEVDQKTIDNWKKVHPEFFRSLKEGKAEADAAVVKSLYRRALGYSHRAVKIFADPKSGTEHIVEYTERYPPDTTAIIFWLKNRQRDRWRDRHDHEHEAGGSLAELLAAASGGAKA